MDLVTAKSLLAYIVLILVLVQFSSMGQVRGYVRFLPLKPKQLVLLHRWSGATITTVMLITVAVGLAGVLLWDYRLYSLRWQVHAVLGGLAAVILVTKALIANRFRQYLGHHQTLGIIAGSALLLTFVLSELGNFLNLS